MFLNINGIWIYTIENTLFKIALWILYIIEIIMWIDKANKEEDPELPSIGNIAKAIFGKK